MKRVCLGLALLVSGCGDSLKHDVEMFCSAVVGSSAKTYNEIGPYVAERARSDEFKAMLRESVGGGLTIWEIADKVRGWMKQTGVTSCKTLDVIVPPRPQNN
jgi:hypothetical protein